VNAIAESIIKLMKLGTSSVRWSSVRMGWDSWWINSMARL